VSLRIRAFAVDKAIQPMLSAAVHQCMPSFKLEAVSSSQLFENIGRSCFTSNETVPHVKNI